RRDLGAACDRVRQVRAAPVEDAGERADGAVRDGEGRALVTDAYGDHGGLRLLAHRGGRLGERPQQRERLEVDAHHVEAGRRSRGQVAVDRLAVGDGDDDGAVDRALRG